MTRLLVGIIIGMVLGLMLYEAASEQPADSAE